MDFRWGRAACTCTRSRAELADVNDFLFNWRFLPHDFDVSSWIDSKPLELGRKLLVLKPKTAGLAQSAPAL